MKSKIGLIAICVPLLGLAMQAQFPKEAPKPGPEVNRLAYFVGNWKITGKYLMHGKSVPMMATQRWEWMPGKVSIIQHADSRSPLGIFKTMAVMRYDRDAKMYIYNEFDSTGGAVTSRGTVSGDTWTWTSDMMDGKSTKSWVTIKEISKTQCTFTLETSPDGSTWTPGIESTLAKVTTKSAVHRE